MRLIDATPIPLSGLSEWAGWNGRTRGLKTHMIYDPDADRPVHLEITAATVNDCRGRPAADRAGCDLCL